MLILELARCVDHLNITKKMIFLKIAEVIVWAWFSLPMIFFIHTSTKSLECLHHILDHFHEEVGRKVNRSKSQIIIFKINKPS